MRVPEALAVATLPAAAMMSADMLSVAVTASLYAAAVAVVVASARASEQRPRRRDSRAARTPDRPRTHRTPEWRPRAAASVSALDFDSNSDSDSDYDSVKLRLMLIAIAPVLIGYHSSCPQDYTVAAVRIGTIGTNETQ